MKSEEVGEFLDIIKKFPHLFESYGLRDEIRLDYEFNSGFRLFLAVF